MYCKCAITTKFKRHLHSLVLLRFLARETQFNLFIITSCLTQSFINLLGYSSVSILFIHLFIHKQVNDHSGFFKTCLCVCAAGLLHPDPAGVDHIAAQHFTHRTKPVQPPVFSWWPMGSYTEAEQTDGREQEMSHTSFAVDPFGMFWTY